MSEKGMFGGRLPRRKKKKRGPNPETIVTNQMRGLLDMMRVAHFKHWAGPMSETGISDICGTLPGTDLLPGREVIDREAAVELAEKLYRKGEPLVGNLEAFDPEKALEILAAEVWRLHKVGGRAFWCEVKMPGKEASEEQESFLEKMRAAGGIAFVAHGPEEMLKELSKAGFEPARNINQQFPGGNP